MNTRTMLLNQRTLDGIVAGRIELVFRKWKRPTVKSGGTLNTSVGQLEIDAVDRVSISSLDRHQAVLAGFSTLKELKESLRAGEDRKLYRVKVRFGGEDPRIQLRNQKSLSASDRSELLVKLDRMDGAIADPRLEALQLLRLLAENEGVRAPDLAETLGVETKWFKTRIRRLKALGLTESLRIGYNVSPRGRALLDNS